MELENGATDAGIILPTLILPKICTNFKVYSDNSNGMSAIIDLNITTLDTAGKETVVYSGLCNINLVNTYELDVQDKSNDHNMVPTGIEDDVYMMELEDANHMYPTYTQSQVWMDPDRGPYVFNHYDTEKFQNCSIYNENQANHITFAQHNTYVTQNINYYEPPENIVNNNYEVKKYRDTNRIVQVNKTKTNQNISVDNPYEENEFEHEAYMSQWNEEIINENRANVREEQRYIELQNENAALQQLKSLDTHSNNKQRKTILFYGHDSQNGQTVQKVNVSNETSRECHRIGTFEDATEDAVMFDESAIQNYKNKKYQCDKCNQIFDNVSALKRHNKSNDHDYYPSLYEEETKSADESKMKCHECGRSFSNEEKFELHCMRHGDPDLECEKCHKVLSSKFTLKNHLKTHNRKYPCEFCTKSFARKDKLVSHTVKNHYTFMCDHCEFTSLEHSEMEEHKLIHILNESEISEITETLDIMSKSFDQDTGGDTVIDNEMQEVDEDIAIVIANEVFQMSSKSKEYRRYSKFCGVCLKPFNRISDLKRHLIEHVIRNTLTKTPVSESGTLNMLCEICRTVYFNTVDKYKAHLRKHANLTLYKCTFCNKSFSDSSNFSKHKKVHGSRYLQCDLCQRKFNTKKMLTNHITMHNKNPPLPCSDCNRTFHFESMLKKHIRTTHHKELTKIVRCKFCKDTFKSLKEKWDHEWSVHKARKTIIDCLSCGSKFRKYTDLKKHCHHTHGVLILPAKKLMKNNVIQVGPF